MRRFGRPAGQRQWTNSRQSSLRHTLLPKAKDLCSRAAMIWAIVGRAFSRRIWRCLAHGKRCLPAPLPPCSYFVIGMSTRMSEPRNLLAACDKQLPAWPSAATPRPFFTFYTTLSQRRAESCCWLSAGLCSGLTGCRRHVPPAKRTSASARMPVLSPSRIFLVVQRLHGG